MTQEYRQGQQHRNAGKSIHYNPYRHRGTPQQYVDWERGWYEADLAIAETNAN